MTKSKFYFEEPSIISINEIQKWKHRKNCRFYTYENTGTCSIISIKKIMREHKLKLERSNATYEIQDLGLPTRLTNCLLRNDIKTLNNLLNCTEEFLLQINDIGPKSVVLIKEKLKNQGLNLKCNNVV